MDDNDTRTKFEKDLEAFFPEIYKLHVYGLFDPKLWSVIYKIYEFYEGREYGEVVIKFQGGKINHAYKTEAIEEEKKNK